jgi:hypothetical protein
MTRGHCWNTLLQQWQKRLLLEHNIASMAIEFVVGTYCCDNGKRRHCWLTIMTYDHIATMILDITVAFDTTIAFVNPFERE